MDKLLRKRDLIDAVGVAKSTVSDWITEFNVYIPTVKLGAVTYYRPEAVIVLNTIKEFREIGYGKPQILGMLSTRGFPVTIEEAVEDVQRVLNQPNSSDTLLNVMQTIGQAVGEIGKHNEQLYQHETRLDGQDERMLVLEKTVTELKRQLLVTNQELSLAIAKEEDKPLWRRLFKL